MTPKIYTIASEFLSIELSKEELLSKVVMLSDYEELQRKVEALAAENCIQDYIISAVKELTGESTGVVGWHLNGDIASWDEVLPELNHSDTPATDAALAEVHDRFINDAVAAISESGAQTVGDAIVAVASMCKEAGK